MVTAKNHDPLFKELLKAFFREFMELFFADVAVRLDFMRTTFLDKETFTDLAGGEQREADLAAQVYSLDGQPDIILVHIEVEARRRAAFPGRMFDYFTLLRWRLKLPVFPIAIYLSAGGGGLVVEEHVERLFERDINAFRYSAVGLPDLSADDYRSLDNPLGPALSALMKGSRLGRVAQKYESLRAMARSGIDPARLALLTNVVESYLILDPIEQEQFTAMVASPDGREVREMISVYEKRGIEQGIEQGIGRGKRDTLLMLLERKFGALPQPVREQIQLISRADVLDDITSQVLTAESLADLRFPSA